MSKTKSPRVPSEQINLPFVREQRGKLDNNGPECKRCGSPIVDGYCNCNRLWEGPKIGNRE